MRILDEKTLLLPERPRASTESEPGSIEPGGFASRSRAASIRRPLRALRERSEQSGEPIIRLAQRYIDEGMQLDRDPGIIFRDGPAGRRPIVVGGPDVWEVIAAARSAPERGDELVDALAERIGVPIERIRIAIRYYAEYPEDVDRFIALVEEEAGRLERTLERERSLLE